MRTPRNNPTELDLAERAWRAGFRGVSGLAREIGCNRVSIYRAAQNPRRYGPLWAKISALLSHENN
jgi:DNA-binding phage protein